MDELDRNTRRLGNAAYQVRENPVGPGFICAYICMQEGCGKPVAASGPAFDGEFTGECANKHLTTLTAPAS